MLRGVPAEGLRRTAEYRRGFCPQSASWSDSKCPKKDKEHVAPPPGSLYRGHMYRNIPVPQFPLISSLYAKLSQLAAGCRLYISRCDMRVVSIISQNIQGQGFTLLCFSGDYEHLLASTCDHSAHRVADGVFAPCLVPAKVPKGPDNMKAKKGTTVVLKAEIRGEPPPDAAWLKDGDDIDEDDRVFFDIGDTNTILTIKNAKLSDAGRYEVCVENSLGSDQSFMGPHLIVYKNNYLDVDRQCGHKWN
uniref:Ig-like domain-containing protein n=1 Tax=Cyclopterus lumpus TaxID=8103 RepID=A0A8C3A7Q9_CYCLU